MPSNDPTPPQSDSPQPFAFPTSERPHEGEKVAAPGSQSQPAEDQLDEGIAESFPASDPVSVMVSKSPNSGTADGKTPRASLHGQTLPWRPTSASAALLSAALLGVGIGAGLMWCRQRDLAHRLARESRRFWR